jgi:pyruvate dehydrogenase E2 component (dihydrolipoamide acetyltransferase)
MAQQKEIVVPDIGDFDDVEVIEVLVAPGDTVTEEQSLITLESDKASMEVPSPHAGRVVELRLAVGDRVAKGSPMLVLELDQDAAAPKADAATTPATPAAAEKPAAAAAATAAAEEIRVPDIGDFDDVEVIEVLVAPGDTVTEEQSLITLESDKASMEVPAPRAGRVAQVMVKVGDRVSEGSPILQLEAVSGDAPAAAAPAASTERAPAKSAPEPPAAAPPTATPPARPRQAPLPAVEEGTFRRAHASPAVRRFARELGADLGRIDGSGPKGRILKEDVKAWIKGRLSGAASAAPGPAAGAGIPPIPAVDFSQFGAIETADLSRIKRLSGPHLHRVWLNLPMVTHHDEADVTDLEAFRGSLKAEAEKRGVRVTALVFIIKALVDALRAFPDFNASLSPDGSQLIRKQYFNVGIAVDTPNGLVVPVIRGVDGKSIFDLSAELAELSDKARNGKLAPADMQGGCISISSLGGIGGTAFTPIVNAPEVAILGVTRARMQPVWDGSDFVPRLLLPLDLTYDHRVIDGAAAARFCARLCQTLGDIRRLLL